ncbi:hypothetical protein N7495_007426 [Penicillium taxi]|uniref:uncharacterized protein n=1 Tax=Penicillium taxi TaxID=168475 RepID=UPI002544E839|nr:uncharacterized protein N7495_007426 [Penicillium taxi]KAJ5887385.1 hypothetical protein N7495_007426 [Penicillium taxi]
MTYFTFIFDGALDSQRLATACHALVARHPMLRTLFFVHNRQALNAVLKSVDCGFLEFESEGDLRPQIDRIVEDLLKASWSLVLRELSRVEDVVFGQLVSGRNLPIHEAESILGCCVNVVPVRVALKNTKILELLNQVQNNYIATVAYETLDFTKIVEKGTSWPRETRFSSILQHQNLNDIVESIPFVDTTLSWNKGAVTQKFAQDVHARLCDIILAMSQDPHGSMASITVPITDMPTIPIPVVDYDPPVLTTLFKISLVDEAWRTVLGCSDEVPGDFSFFETWVEGILAAQFVRFYQARGIILGVEEVLEAPTKNALYVLIGQKLAC